MSARGYGVIGVDDVELAVRLLVDPLLTYVLGSGLLAPDGIPHAPSPEHIAALVRLVLHGIASHDEGGGGEPQH